MPATGVGRPRTHRERLAPRLCHASREGKPPRHPRRFNGGVRPAAGRPGRRSGTSGEKRLSSRDPGKPSLLQPPGLLAAASVPPNTYFHVEVANDALIDRFAEVEAVYPGGMLHMEAANEFPIGMLVAPFVSAEEVVAGYERLRQLDVPCTARTSTTWTSTSTRPEP